MANQRSFVKDSLGVFSTRILLILVGIVGGIIIARMLGPTNKGILAIVVLVPTILVSIGHLGIGQASLYFIGKKKFDFQSILSNALALSIILGILLIVLSLSVILLLRNSIFLGVNFLFIALALFTIPFLLFIKFTDFILMGRQMILKRNLLHITNGIMGFIGIVLFVLVLRLGIKGALISTLVGLLVGTLYGLYNIKQIARVKLHFNFALFKDSVSYGIKPYLALIVLSLNYKFDIFLIKYFLTDTDVGYYSLAVSIAEKLWFLPSAIGIVTFSRIATLDVSEANKLTPRVCRNALLISFLTAILLLATARLFIPILYGKAFVPSINPFMVLLPGVIAMTIHKVLHSDLVGRGRPEISVYVFSGALILNILLNLYLIPRIGIIGAALSSAISYSSGALTLAFIFSRISAVALHKILIPRWEDLRNYRAILLKTDPKMKLSIEQEVEDYEFKN